jgi:hypothetical protein
VQRSRAVGFGCRDFCAARQGFKGSGPIPGFGGSDQRRCIGGSCACREQEADECD